MVLKNKKRIVIVGATSTIALHCARLWVEKEHVVLTLVGRDETKMHPIAADLKIRNPQTEIEIIEIDFFKADNIQKLIAQVFTLSPLDIVLIAHGLLPDQHSCQEDLLSCQEAIMINAVSPALFAEAFANRMQKVNHGTLALIGSVAGDRGRKSNYIYGASKGFLATFVEGLQHRMAFTNVKVVLIKPGPTQTPMTAHLQQNMADPKEVAQIIIKGIAKGQPVIYAPAKWAFIMKIIKHLPRFIFNRMDI